MKNTYSNFLLIFFSCFSFASYAQGDLLLNTDEQKIILSYGKSLHDLGDEISAQVMWIITDMDKNEVIASGSGDALTKYVFEKPGMYQVDINENLIHDQNSCNHKHFPEKMLVEVSPLKMDFDFKSVKVSRNIIGGQSVNDTMLSIDVRFSSYDNSDAVYKQGFNTAGVGTSVAGKLKNGEAKLRQGKNTLEFKLEGQATKGTYIMIDFVDINGQVQTYGFTNKIQ
jgi:hypothetical protein